MFFFSKILYCYFINGLFKLNAIQMVNDCQAQGSSTSSGAAAIEGPPCLIVLGMAGAGKTSFVQVWFVPVFRISDVLFSA